MAAHPTIKNPCHVPELRFPNLSFQPLHFVMPLPGINSGTRCSFQDSLERYISEIWVSFASGKNYGKSLFFSSSDYCALHCTRYEDPSCSLVSNLSVTLACCTHRDVAWVPQVQCRRTRVSHSWHCCTQKAILKQTCLCPMAKPPTSIHFQLWLPMQCTHHLLFILVWEAITAWRLYQNLCI